MRSLGEDDLKRVLQELDEHKATRQTLEAEHQIFHDFVPNGICRQYIEDINQILYIYKFLFSQDLQQFNSFTIIHES